MRTHDPTNNKATPPRLRSLLNSPVIARIIGCSDAVGARIAQEAGFDGVWASGLAISANRGVPDASILTMSELLDASRVIGRATALPVVADCDTGFGGPANAAHMAREYQSAGISGVSIEDKAFPKVNSFAGRRQLATIEDFAQRLRAARATAHADSSVSDGAHLVIIARIGSFIVGAPQHEALERAFAYGDAGADAILIHSKAATAGEVISFAKTYHQHGGKLPLVCVPMMHFGIKSHELEDAGFAMVIYENQGLQATVRTLESVYKQILRGNVTEGMEAGLAPMSRIFDLIGMGRGSEFAEDAPCSRSRLTQHVLLNPGPVNVHPSVREAIASVDICHREPEFFAILEQVSHKIVRLCGGGPEHGAVVLTGSGTAALEASISSVVPSGTSLLALDNGTYGDRIRQIAATVPLPVEHYRVPWGQPFDIGRIEAILASNRLCRTVALAHHETSTGMLNDLRSIGEVAHRYGAKTIVDAISTVGGEPLDLEDDHIDWCIGSSNKCIEGLPGVSFVCARLSDFDALEKRSAGAFYLDLASHFHSQYEAKAPLFTPAVQVCVAFERALDLILQETVAGRCERYLALANRLRAGLKEIGFRFLLPESQMSRVVTLVYLPEGATFSLVHDYCKSRGFIVYPTQESLGPVFRIATIGQVTALQIDMFLHTLGIFVRKCPSGSEL